jgi:uncharacterized protein (TIRG00374 family)
MEWVQFWDCIQGVRPTYLGLPIALTVLSYFWRTLRWRHLFPREVPSIKVAYKALIFGFFMNNILPARAGELVRAHVGARLSGESRSLVLATIAAERLLDGVALSVLLGIGSITMGILGLHVAEYAHQLQYVGVAFAVVGILTVLLLSQRGLVDSLLLKCEGILAGSRFTVVLSKIRHFIEGLTPLLCPRRLPIILGWTSVVWGLELMVFWVVASAYGVHLTIYQAIFFLVSSNFASLIPAAPGGIGIVEAVATAVLVSMGVPRESAFAMALTQHVIQYAMVGLPGLYLLLRFRELRGVTASPS